jgi:hypothetical protein
VRDLALDADLGRRSSARYAGSRRRAISAASAAAVA